MKTFNQFILEDNKILTLYHCSKVSDSKEFKVLTKKLFLSTEMQFSMTYGDYMYQVTINPKKIFDSTSDEHRKETMDYIKMKIKERLTTKQTADEIDFYETVNLEMLNSHSTWHWVEMIFKSPYMGSQYFNERSYDALLITEEKAYKLSGDSTNRVVNYMIWSADVILDFKLIGTIDRKEYSLRFIPLEKNFIQ
jgi:hypothetical protein